MAEFQTEIERGKERWSEGAQLVEGVGKMCV